MEQVINELNHTPLWFFSGYQTIRNRREITTATSKKNSITRRFLGELRAYRRYDLRFNRWHHIATWHITQNEFKWVRECERASEHSSSLNLHALDSSFRSRDLSDRKFSTFTCFHCVAFVTNTHSYMRSVCVFIATSTDLYILFAVFFRLFSSVCISLCVLFSFFLWWFFFSLKIMVHIFHFILWQLLWVRFVSFGFLKP